MNDLDRELNIFLRQLHQFNQDMAQDWDELNIAWEDAGSLWTLQDNTRRRFENDWGEMGDILSNYRKHVGAAYERFLLGRKKAIDQYFGRR